MASLVLTFKVNKCDSSHCQSIVLVSLLHGTSEQGEIYTGVSSILPLSVLCISVLIRGNYQSVTMLNSSDATKIVSTNIKS